VRSVSGAEDSVRNKPSQISGLVMIYIFTEGDRQERDEYSEF
jgi:hypothetical protein